MMIIALVVIILVLVLPNVRIVPQQAVYVIERLGKYQASWEAGIHVKIPILDRIVKKISLKEQVLDFPPQPARVPAAKQPTKNRESIFLFFIVFLLFVHDFIFCSSLI